MTARHRRRLVVRALPLALGSSALAAACSGPPPGSVGGLNPGIPPTQASTNQVAPSAATTSSSNSASSSAAALAPPYPLARNDLGTRGSAKLEYATLPAGGTLNLLNWQGGPGYVSHLWLAINCADALGRDQTRYRITVDGEKSPSIDSTMAGFHAADFDPNANFATRWIGYNQRDSLKSYYAYIPIPFSSSISVDVVNGSSGAAATVFAIADFHHGIALPWGRMQKLHTFEKVTTVAPYAWQDLLNVTGQPAGVLWGVYLRFQGGDSTFGYLEGNVQMFADGSTSTNYESSGTEDYFNNAWYFQTGVIFADHSGCTRYDNVGYSIGAYRFHLDDPFPFENALRVRWQNGAADQAKVVNPTSLRSHVWYYTES